MRHKIVNVNVDKNLKDLLKKEDLDRDLKITIEDYGPKNFLLKTVDGDEISVKGHYPLSNLLQLLAHAHSQNEKTKSFELDKLYQSSLDQVNEQILNFYWPALTRTMDEKGLIELLEDPKHSNEKKTLYVPYDDFQAFDYFKKCALDHPYLKLKVFKLPEKINSVTIEKLNKKPGLLSLSIQSDPENGNPFIVPGGRFNEMYGWDSYFIIEGLLLSKEYEIAVSMYKHLLYQIKHYGKILNANRSYYLSRSQPPFLTSIILLLIEHVDKFSMDLIYEGLLAAINEYENVWLSKDRLCANGLSRYFGEGEKEPLEVEKGHFDYIYSPFAEKLKMSLKAYRKAYNASEIEEPKLDEFFMHDRSMRESGHDTTYRLIGKSAYLNTVDLNSLLYKYEIDISEIMDKYFKGEIKKIDGQIETSKLWKERASSRRSLMHQLMKDEKTGLFFDYDFKKCEKTDFESATMFYVLFAKLLDDNEARLFIENALPLFESNGGLVGTTEKSRGEISDERPLRQWDYPFGWAPHQMIFWQGADYYGFTDEVKRLAYKWLYMITKEAQDYNGVLAEKYDVVGLSHKLCAEYGNVGVEFGLYPNGGFGWLNASYLKGQTYLGTDEITALKELKSPQLMS